MNTLKFQDIPALVWLVVETILTIQNPLKVPVGKVERIKYKQTHMQEKKRQDTGGGRAKVFSLTLIFFLWLFRNKKLNFKVSGEDRENKKIFQVSVSGGPQLMLSLFAPLGVMLNLSQFRK